MAELIKVMAQHLDVRDFKIPHKLKLFNAQYNVIKQNKAFYLLTDLLGNHHLVLDFC